MGEMIMPLIFFFPFSSDRQNHQLKLAKKLEHLDAKEPQPTLWEFLETKSAKVKEHRSADGTHRFNLQINGNVALCVHVYK